MNKRIVLFVLTLTVTASSWSANLLTVDFETAGDGYTPSTTTGSGYTDIFNRTAYATGGKSGSDYYWAAEDIGGNPTITLDTISISGYSSFDFYIDLLERNNNDWDSTDEVKIMYKVDSGSWQNLMWIQAHDDDSYNEPACIDRGFDGAGDIAEDLPAITDGHGTSPGNTFATFSETGVSVSGNNLYIRIEFYNLTSNDEGIYMDNITIDGTGGSTPTINVSPSSIAFGNVTVNTAATNTYTLSASDLSPASGNITVTAPSTEYRVATTPGSWNSSVNVAYSGGTLANTTIYVRYAPTNLGTDSGNVSNAGGGATTENVAVSGTGSAPPNPSSFSVAKSTPTQINVSYAANALGHNVVVVFDTDNSFSTPSGSPPSPGNSFAGGTLIVNGASGSPYAHTGRTPGETYYYKAWSYDSAGNFYSSGLTDNDTTDCFGAPTAQAGSGADDDSFTANWSSLSGATGYLLDVATNDAFNAGGGGTLDIGGYSVSDSSARTFTFPSGTIVTNGDYVVIGRNAASQSAFETAWGISTLEHYFDGNNSFPVCNGTYSYTLKDDSSTTIETTASLDVNGDTNERNNTTDAASSSGSWTKSTDANATPGSGANGNGAAGLVINEVSDGDSSYVYEFVELYYDAAGGGGGDFVPGYQARKVGNVTSFTVTGLTASTTYYYRLRATNDNCVSPYSSTITVSTTSGNASPTDMALSDNNINENAGANATVGTLSTTDSDLPSDSHTYTLVSGAGSTDNGSFNISGTSLRADSSLNHEAKDTYYVRVRTTDSGGLWYEEAFTINVVDVNEAPTDLSLSNQDIDEGQPADTVIGNFSTTDPDDGDTFVYTLVSGTGDSGNGSFNINGNQLRSDVEFDYETQSSYSIRVQTRDAGGTGYTRVETYTITINDVNESVPTVDSPTKSSITENSATLGATVSDQGGSSISDYGIVWDTSADPETTDNKVQEGTSTTPPTTFTLTASSLPAASHIYYRGYAVNSYGAGYSAGDDFYTEPSQQPSVSFSLQDTDSMRVSWTGGNGDGTIVVMRKSSLPTTSHPVDGTEYAQSSTYGSGDALASGYVVYVGSGSQVDVTGLDPNSTYYVALYEYAGVGAKINYQQDSRETGSSSTTVASQPTTQASGAYFINRNEASMTLQWTNGNGSDVIVLLREGSAVNANPADGSTYSASSVFESGAEIGTGNYVVYNGTGTNVTITGLSRGSNYHAAVYTFNGAGGAENYLTASPATADAWTLDSVPTTDASSITFNNVTVNSMTVGWTRGDGDYCLVVARQGSAPTQPTDGETYSADASFGSGDQTEADSFVVYKGTGNSVDVTALSGGSTYFFSVYEFNRTQDSTENYRTTGAPTASQSTAAPDTSDPVINLFATGEGEATTVVNGGLYISEIADPSDNYEVRFVELYNASGSTIDFSTETWYLSREANGSGSWEDHLLIGSVAAGSTYVIQYNQATTAEFYTAYGVYADDRDQVCSGSGNDGYFLYKNGDHTSGTLIDSYGVIGVDGNGEAWEYTDSRAYRDSTIVTGNPSWVSSEWTIASAASTGCDPQSHTGPSSGGSSTDWDPVNDAIIASGTYGVTCTVQDVGDGLTVSNAFAPRFALFDADGSVLYSNYFRTAFPNGTSTEQTMVSNSPSISDVSAITIGWATAHVWVADTGGRSASASHRINIVDDDTTAPVVSGIKVTGATTNFNSGLSALTITGRVVETGSSVFNAGGYAYFYIENPADGSILSGSSNNFSVAGAAGMTATWNSQGLTCGNDYTVYVFVADSDLDRGAADLLTDDDNTLVIHTTGSGGVSDYPEADDVEINGSAADAAVTVTDQSISNGSWVAAMSLYHPVAVFTADDTPSFNLYNAADARIVVTQKWSDINVNGTTYYLTNDPMPSIDAADIDLGAYELRWSASNDSDCVASAHDMDLFQSGTNIFTVIDDDNAAPELKDFRVAGVVTIEQTVAEAGGFSFTGLVQDTGSGIWADNSELKYSVKNPAGGWFHENQTFSAKPGNGGATSWTALGATIGACNPVDCSAILTVVVYAADFDGDRTLAVDSASMSQEFKFYIAGDHGGEVQTSDLKLTNTAAAGIDITDEQFTDGGWDFSMFFDDPALVTSGPDEPSFYIEDSDGVNIYSSSLTFNEFTAGGGGTFATNNNMPASDADILGTGTFQVVWSAKGGGLCYTESDESTTISGGSTFFVRDDDPNPPNIVDNFSVAGGTAGGLNGQNCTGWSTNLQAGEVAIIGMNTLTVGSGEATNHDSFAFVALRPIPAGTRIKITDGGWNSIDQEIHPYEGTLTWEADNCVTAGTVIVWKRRNNPGDTNSAVSINVGSIIDDDYFFKPNTYGEQLTLYQDDPGNTPPYRFLYCLHTGRWGWPRPTPPTRPSGGNWKSSEQSAIPPGLVEGETAIAVTNLNDVVLRTNHLDIVGQSDEVLAYIGNPTHWMGNDDHVYALDTWTFSFPGLGSAGGQISDQDIYDGGWAITGQVRDVYSGLLASSVRYEIFNATGTVALLETFPGVANGSTALQNLNASSVGTGAYWHITLGTYTAIIHAADTDDDWDGDSAVAIREVPFTVVDDDDDSPQLQNLTFNGSAYLDVALGVSSVSVTARVTDATSGIAFDSYTPYILIFSNDTLVASNRFLYCDGSHVDGEAKTGDYVNAWTDDIDMNAFGCGSFTCQVVLADADNDRIGDRHIVTNWYVLDLSSGSESPPDLRNDGLQVNEDSPASAYVTDAMINTGNWPIAIALEHTSGIMTNPPNEPRYELYNVNNVEMFGLSWTNYRLSGGDQYFDGTNVMPGTPPAEFNEINLGLYRMEWHARSYSACEGGTNGIVYIEVEDDDPTKPNIVDNWAIAGGTGGGGGAAQDCNLYSTNLQAGDVAIIGMNTLTIGSPPTLNADSFAFVALRPIPSGTRLKITDNGWKSDNTLYTGEGVLTWEADSCITAGTVVIWRRWDDPSNSASGVYLSEGSIVDDDYNFQVNKQAEQILIYQDDPNGMDNKRFIYALQTGSWGWPRPDPGSWKSSEQTALPPGLVDGETCVSVVNLNDVVIDTNTAAQVVHGSQQEVLQYISDDDNWVGNDDHVYPLDHWIFTFPDVGSAGGTITDEDILYGRWDITGQVSDVQSGLDDEACRYIAINSSNNMVVSSGKLAGIVYGTMETQNVNMTSVNAGTYDYITLGMYTCNIWAADIDMDRPGDRLTNGLFVEFWVEDDDEESPQFFDITWNGKAVLDVNDDLSKVVVTASVADFDSGIAFDTAPPYILIYSNGLPVYSNAFAYPGTLNDGDAYSNSIEDIWTDEIDIAAMFGCGSFTCHVVLVDADNDRPNDRRRVTNLVEMTLAAGDAVSPSLADGANSLRANGIPVDGVVTQITDETINDGAWNLEIDLYHPQGVLTNFPERPFFTLFNANDIDMLADYWTNYTLTATNFFGDNDVPGADVDMFQLINTGLYSVIWEARSLSACDGGGIGTNRMRVIDDDREPPEWTPNLTVLGPGGGLVTSWTNVQNFTVRWNDAVDYSGVHFQHVVNTNPLDSFTLGDHIGSTTNFNLLNVPEGAVTNWLYAVDEDNDRPDDALRSTNINFLLRVDVTRPERVTNLYHDNNKPVDDTSEIALQWSKVGPGDKLDGTPLSPWDSYLVYVAENEANGATTVYNRAQYSLFADTNTTQIVLTNLIFGTEYRVWMAGKDMAGNIGPFSPTAIVELIGFNLTQGMAAVVSGKDAHLSWTAESSLGRIVKNFDLIHVDEPEFRNDLIAEWKLVDTVHDSFDIDDGGKARPSILHENFNGTNLMPMGWTYNSGMIYMADDEDQFNSAPYARAIQGGAYLNTPRVNRPYHIYFAGRCPSGISTARLEYRINNGTWQQVDYFNLNTNVTYYDYSLRESPNLTEATNVQFAFYATADYFYLDDVLITGGGVGPVRPAPGDLPPGAMRFYRASFVGRWRPGQQNRSASKEIYVLKNTPLGAGQNWIALPGLPDDNHLADVIGNDLPHAQSAGIDSNTTTISWFNRSSGVVTQQVYLNASRNWQYSVGGSGTANDLSIPRNSGLVIDVPSPTNIMTIGRVPTNGVSQYIPGGGIGSTNFALVSFNLPRRLHPGQLGLEDAGFRSVTDWPDFVNHDLMWKWDGQNQVLPDYIVHWPSMGGWVSLTTMKPVKTNYFMPDDAIVIVRPNAQSPMSWTLPTTNFYNSPTIRMNP